MSKHSRGMSRAASPGFTVDRQWVYSVDLTGGQTMTTQRLIKYGAAICGFVAGILLFYSLTITSSPFKPIVTADGAHLCFNGKLLVAGYGGPLVLSPDPCPGWTEGNPAALVSAEHPYFIRWGLFLLVISFGLQLADIWTSRSPSGEKQVLKQLSERPNS
jgi:hypothetical protein